MSRVCILAIFLCAVFAAEYVNGNLIRSSGVVEKADEKKPVVQNVVIQDIVKDSPDEVPRQCKKIGEFCMNHSDCCTHSCLGYLKRCVSS